MLTGMLLRAAQPVLGNVAVPPIVFSFGALWVLLFPVIAAIEAAIITRYYKWSYGRAFRVAVVINAFTAFIGVFPALFMEAGAEWAVGAVPISTAYRLWPLSALVLLAAFYLGTFLLEAWLLHTRACKISPGVRPGHALKASAVFNLATYLMIAPVWFVGMAASMRGAKLVHKSRWLPDVREAFLYDRRDGSTWLGTTKGEQLGEVYAQQLYIANSAYKIAEDGQSLVLLSYTRADEVAGDPDPRAPAAASVTETARYPLPSLDAELRLHVRPGSTSGLPRRDADGRIREWPRLYDYRDGTLARGSGGERLEVFLDVVPESVGPGAWGFSQVEEEGRPVLLIRGSPGLMQELRFDSPNVLPGGRYVLFECSGEIMVLDVEQRKIVGLFRGRNPVALASFEPEEEDQPQIATDGTD